ncbi:uncharacterized protein CLUP02_11657 [Colletotrichum lupini]|uniref:Uncharacterized protein n=1 Tax=Colletotrichum lupini TaxID=145971 RepID=A0A9Q8SZ36_9PEZI|nr:uncharacterized protein CLUP02_11657 [Colletotrichum lupini]UQC86157.1 hypothetical protein CLUP02_11657 [Colletotrichum lupini]
MQPPWYIGLSSLTQDKSSLHLHGRRKPQPHQPQQQECELFLLHLHCEPRGQSSQALLAFPVEAMRIHSLLAPHPAGLEQRRPGNAAGRWTSTNDEIADATNTKERAAYKTWASFHFFFPVADFLHGNLLDNFYMRQPMLFDGVSFCSDPRTVLALGHPFAPPTVQNTRASSQRDQQVMRQSMLFAHGGLGIRGLRLSPPNSSRQPASMTVTEDAGRTRQKALISASHGCLAFLGTPVREMVTPGLPVTLAEALINCSSTDTAVVNPESPSGQNGPSLRNLVKVLSPRLIDTLALRQLRHASPCPGRTAVRFNKEPKPRDLGIVRRCAASTLSANCPSDAQWWAKAVVGLAAFAQHPVAASTTRMTVNVGIFFALRNEIIGRTRVEGGGRMKETLLSHWSLPRRAMWPGLTQRCCGLGLVQSPVQLLSTRLLEPIDGTVPYRSRRSASSRTQTWNLSLNCTPQKEHRYHRGINISLPAVVTISATHQRSYEDSSGTKEKNCRSMYIMSVEGISLDASPRFGMSQPHVVATNHQGAFAILPGRECIFSLIRTRIPASLFLRLLNRTYCEEAISLPFSHPSVAFPSFWRGLGTDLRPSISDFVHTTDRPALSASSNSYFLMPKPRKLKGPGITRRGTYAPTLRHQEPANSHLFAQNELASPFELIYHCFRLWYPTGYDIVASSRGALNGNIDASFLHQSGEQASRFLHSRNVECRLQLAKVARRNLARHEPWNMELIDSAICHGLNLRPQMVWGPDDTMVTPSPNFSSP